MKSSIEYAACVTIDTFDRLEKFEVKSATLQKVVEILNAEGIKRSDKRACGDLYMIEQGNYTAT